jgi:hypothetical protein
MHRLPNLRHTTISFIAPSLVSSKNALKEKTIFSPEALIGISGGNFEIAQEEVQKANANTLKNMIFLMPSCLSGKTIT